MKKFIIGLLGLTLFLTIPLQTVVAVTLEPQEIKESYQTEIEGKLVVNMPTHYDLKSFIC